ncbi:NADH dehydrogenase subunit 4L (mitochondrion) [Callorhinchus milii]|uniref:NADH-ubiquinone oxidoreductase chain 4L n=3 Tax=Callorhinchus TaxID=7866 RepID=D7RWT5_CALMI|nr:NADH dehydrogenase subunit 4L [Callorhinchus callorynchus]YP_003734919.1 NADH dehydrogenase subunit 4L [Callorhinchus capensis]YP_003734932.1 NADH dehydrogenase subunit 4L [Callorhinchus milii]ADI57809.1 NADH dehydrogenase subunit 4L [Callorhinchus callorynchus]ADI57822.1 NADH dehydrogenase subunit 4L [Callorhinchus capensis]ADI57835.1 NADH dehydrogenase subunit 4L [Callorhinchus milii]|eukprot:gi/299829042/ref/YP_003734932.1/ NADH dehydrogenase subunit 4L (mitochondrion) [Callorhinchus milii]
MTPMHFTFTSAFILSLLGLTIHRTSLLSALLCLEGMMLTLYIALTLWSVENSSSAYLMSPLILLAFSACEACTGLSLLIATTRTHGNNHLQNLNLLQC